MTLLDRFRTQQPQNHPDAAVRLQYVAELPLSDRPTIAAMAREDDDPRVRKAAVGKLMDPAALAAIARDDRDESVRAHAASMLRDIALEAFEEIGEAESLEAVEAIGEPRALAHVAKNAARDITALRALSRLDDHRLIGSVARHAVVEAARRGALDSLLSRGDHAEILAVAMNSDFKDTSCAAVDALADRAELEQIATRAKNKTAARRARTMLREADERAGLTVAESAGVVPDPLAMTATPPHGDPLSTSRPISPAAAETAAADPAEAAAPPAQTAGQPGPEQTGDAATDVAEADLGETAGPTVSAGEHAPRAADADASDAEGAAAIMVADEPPPAPAVVGPSDADITAGNERRLARLGELAAEAAAAAEEVDLPAARKRFALIRREWQELSAGTVDVDSATAGRFVEADARMIARDAEAREQEARTRREALARIHNLLGRVEPLAQKADLTLKAGERALRDVRAALSSMPMLPTRQDHDAALHRLKAAQSALTPKVQELREADEWRRFANVAVQEQLCARMEALQHVDDADAIARDVRELQQQWRAAADVPRAQADALWRRFKTAHDLVWPRVEAQFAAQAQERAENLAKKTVLCEKAEALADSTNWIQAADEIKALQAEWKTIGPVSRGREKAIWERFRSACDRFFRRRHEDLAQRKTVWAENLAKKEALCVRAEALAQSTEWETAAAEIKRLQAEWKTIGPVKKSRSEAIWQRFRGACDAFFARYAQRHDTARAERAAAREALCAELEGLAAEAAAAGSTDAAEPAPAPPDLLQRVRTIRSRWQQEIASRGVEPERAHALDERFGAALNRVMTQWPAAFAGTDLDPEANRKRMETLVKRVEELAASISGPGGSAQADESLSPTTRLAAMLKEALAANTIGGKAEDDSRLRAAAEDARQAQAAWSRIGVVAEEARRPLADRFQKALRRISERTARPAGSRGNTRKGSFPA